MQVSFIIVALALASLAGSVLAGTINGVHRMPMPKQSDVKVASCENGQNLHMYQLSNSQYFWDYNDWGAVHRHQSTLTEYCSRAKKNPEVSLKCNKDLTYCEGKGLWVNIGKKKTYIKDDSRNPTVGSLQRCRLDEKFPPISKGLFSLTDWFPELSTFKDLPTGEESPKCDVFFNETVLITRGDAQANVYHNMCDFVNLYLSLYIGGLENTGLDELSILYWEPERSYPFETMQYDLYKMFTSLPLRHVNNYYGKTLCFRKAVFAVKPRTVFSFFFNQPVAPGCVGGGNSFMRGFSDSAIYAVLGSDALHLAPRHRLRVALLSRSGGVGYTSGTRHVLNEVALINVARKKFPIAEFHIENFDWSAKVPYSEQMRRIRASDVLLGMHGAGLSHMIFLPEWGAVYEIYHCDDRDCYYDLARELGLCHVAGNEDEVTRKVPEGKTEHTNIKFWNYIINEEAFMGHVKQCIDHVLAHPKFVELSQSKEEL